MNNSFTLSLVLAVLASLASAQYSNGTDHAQHNTTLQRTTQEPSENIPSVCDKNAGAAYNETLCIELCKQEANMHKDFCHHVSAPPRATTKLSDASTTTTQAPTTTPHKSSAATATINFSLVALPIAVFALYKE